MGKHKGNKKERECLIKSRNHYEDIKKYDRTQMESFAREMHDHGYMTCKKEIDAEHIIDKVCARLADVEGIGNKLMTRITAALMDLK